MWDDAKQLNAIAATLAVLVAVAMLWAGVAWVVRQPAFAWQEVVVRDPLTRANGAHLEAVVREELAGTFFTMNLDRARAALAKVPWVRRASLSRQWPQRLEVTIEEYMPFARWNGDALVNAEGEVFVADYDGELPLLEGADARATEVTARFVEWSAALAPLSLALREVRVSPRGGWRLKVAGASSSLDIELGREEPDDRLARFVAAYGRTIETLARAGTRVDRVDLRYRNGFAARVPGFRERSAKKTGAA